MTIRKMLVGALRTRPLVLRYVFLIVFLSFPWAVATAQVYVGTFSLPFEARWGGVSLAPGDYSFTLKAYAPTVMTVTPPHGSTMFFQVVSQEKLKGPAKSKLILAKTEQVPDVHLLYIAGLDTAFRFAVPTKARVDVQIISQAIRPESVFELPVAISGH